MGRLCLGNVQNNEKIVGLGIPPPSALSLARVDGSAVPPSLVRPKSVMMYMEVLGAAS